MKAARVKRQRSILDDLTHHLMLLQGEVDVMLAGDEQVKQRREGKLFARQGGVGRVVAAAR